LVKNDLKVVGEQRGRHTFLPEMRLAYFQAMPRRLVSA